MKMKIKVLKLVLILALAVIASTLPAPSLEAQCPYYCYGHGDCVDICGCLGFSTWAYCAPTLNGYPGYCYCT